MGCGASSRATVSPEAASGGEQRGLSGGVETTVAAAAAVPVRVDSPASEAVAGEVEELEVVSAAPGEVTPPRSRPLDPPMAFEVPVLEESLIKKHPPKRFQRLEEQQVSSPLSLEVLEERQAVARHRRIQILNQRVQSAKMRLPKRTRTTDDDVNTDDEAIESVHRENSSVEL